MRFQKPDRGPVRRDTLMDDVLETRPDARRVLWEEFQLPCYDCEVALYETVEQGCSYRGIDPDVMVARLNACALGPEPTDEDDEEEGEG